MTDNSLEENLKKLSRVLMPDEQYSRRSFNAIIQSKLAPKTTPPLPNFVYRLGFIMTVMIVSVLIAIKNDVPLKVAGLDAQGLKAEAEELEIQLRLAEISSYQKQQRTVGAALKETSHNDPGQLSTTLLQKEADSLNIDTNINQDIDSALKELLD